MSVPNLRKLQSGRFRDLVHYMYGNQEFYRRKWDSSGIDPKKVSSIEDISSFPFTKKDDLRDHYPFGLFAVPTEQVVRIHCSSGSTGKPTTVGYTREDLDLFSEVVARSLCCAGAQPGMKLHNAYGYGLFTGGLGLHYGAERLGMSVIPVSGGMTERQIMLLKDFQSEIISCTPSYALSLADAIASKGLKMGDFNLKFAILGAEPWTEKVRTEIERDMGVIATNIYGLSEIVGPGVSQEDFEEKGGSHVWEDHFFPEIVDPESGEVLPEGREGILILTTLTKKAMPLMRYWTNDVCSLFYDPDSKRTHVKMSPITGRYDDMLIIRGVNLFHTQIEAVLAEMNAFSANYQLIVSRQGRLDSILVRLECSDEVYDAKGPSISSLMDSDVYLSDLRSRLEKKLRDTIGLSIRVELVDRNSLPRSEGGKLKRIVDLR